MLMYTSVDEDVCNLHSQGCARSFMEIFLERLDLEYLRTHYREVEIPNASNRMIHGCTIFSNDEGWLYSTREGSGSPCASSLSLFFLFQSHFSWLPPSACVRIPTPHRPHTLQSSPRHIMLYYLPNSPCCRQLICIVALLLAWIHVAFSHLLVCLAQFFSLGYRLVDVVKGNDEHCMYILFSSYGNEGLLECYVHSRQTCIFPSQK